jgi:MFS family permease
MATEKILAVQEALPVPRPVPLWRNRDYLLLWSGQSISVIGTQVSHIALPLLILAFTGSPAQAGFVDGIAVVPYLLFCLLAGAMIDRWNRKKVMILCNLGLGLNMGSIAMAVVIGHLTMAQLYLVSLIEGILILFFETAQIACLPRVVTAEQLPAAMAQNEISNSLATLIGPAIGTALFQTLGSAVPFLSDAVSYLIAALSLVGIKTRFQGDRTAAPGRLHTEIVDGLKWLREHPLISFIAFLGSGANFVGTGKYLIVILLARQLHAPLFAIGIIFSIAASGDILGALIGGWLQQRLNFGHALITISWLTALVWPLYMVAPDFVILGIITAIISGLMQIFNIMQASYRLSLIPDELQGRVNSAFRLISYTGLMLGAASSGSLLQAIGTTSTLLVFLACLLIMAIASTLNIHVRHAHTYSDS